MIQNNLQPKSISFLPDTLLPELPVISKVDDTESRVILGKFAGATLASKNSDLE